MGRCLYKALVSDQEIGPRFSQTSSPLLHFPYKLNSTPLCVRTKPLAQFSSPARRHGKPPQSPPRERGLWQALGPELASPVAFRNTLDRSRHRVHDEATRSCEERPPPQQPRLPGSQPRGAGRHPPYRIHRDCSALPARPGPSDLIT